MTSEIGLAISSPVLRSGAEYYRQAAERIDHAALKQLLLNSLEAREVAAEEISVTMGTRGGAMSQTSIAVLAYYWRLESKLLTEGTKTALLADFCDSEDRSFAEIGAAASGGTPSETGGCTEQSGGD